jgi:phosphate transport system substrate-binding protein
MGSLRGKRTAPNAPVKFINSFEGFVMKLNTRKTCIAAALALSAIGCASSAMAQSVLGGGSSLVGPSIQSEFANQFNPTPNPGTLTYFTTSSGVGQAAFFGNQATSFVSVTPAGVTVTASGTVDFANSDAALTSTQISTYLAGLGATDGPLIQIPFITTAIAIPIVNGPLRTGAPADTFLGPVTTPGQAHSLALNDTDLCGIFSGKLTTWNTVTNPDTGVHFNDTSAITVVYRSDSSGTSELLTRHLTAVCPALTGSTVISPTKTITFVDSTTFAASFPSSTVPSNFIGESGSGGVQAELLSLQAGTAHTAAVGYLSPDWTNTTLASSSSTVSATAPIKELAAASLLNSHITNSPVGTADIAPTFTQADNAVNTVTGPLGVSPVPITQANAAVQTKWVPNVANPTAGYPVAGTSNIILSQCYSNANVASTVINFLTDHYGVTAYKSIIQGNGFDVPTAYVSAIQKEILANTAAFSPALNINGTECTAGVGR